MYRLGIITLCLFQHLAFGQSLIVNDQTSINKISRNTARAIFSMRLKQWPDGSPIVVFVLADDNPLHRAFIRDKLSMFPHQLRRSWDRYVYSGTGLAPIEIDNEQEMLEKVATTPGSIGYTNKENTNAHIRTVPFQ